MNFEVRGLNAGDNLIIELTFKGKRLRVKLEESKLPNRTDNFGFAMIVEESDVKSNKEKEEDLFLDQLLANGKDYVEQPEPPKSENLNGD